MSDLTVIQEEPVKTENPYAKNKRTAYDAMQPQPPMDWIVDHLISEESITIFYGDGGVGKTYSMLSLAIHVAEGTDWLGFKIPRSKNVLLLNEESKDKKLSSRIHEVLSGEKGDEKTPFTYYSMIGTSLDKTNSVDMLKVLINDCGAKLVIIDSFAATMNGDENTKKDTQLVFNNLRKVIDATGCSFIIIHHANKNAKDIRGSSAINAACDLSVKMKRIKGNVIVFETDKTRDIEKTTWSAEAVLEETEFFYLKPLNVSTQSKPKEKAMTRSQICVLDYLKENGDSLKTDIIRGITNNQEYVPDTIKKAIEDLDTFGKIKRTNPETGTKNAIFSLTQ